MSDNKHCKLLDMLAGWSQFCDENGKPSDAARIADLYQQAGKMEDVEDDGNRTNERITTFLVNDVLQFILRDK
jgi:hypothetical protein